MQPTGCISSVCVAACLDCLLARCRAVRATELAALGADSESECRAPELVEERMGLDQRVSSGTVTFWLLSLSTGQPTVVGRCFLELGSGIMHDQARFSVLVQVANLQFRVYVPLEEGRR